MIKYKTIEVLEKKYIAESITCDICKKEFFYHNDDNIGDEMEIQEFVRFRSSGGYSSVFGDGSSIEIDMCQHCFRDKLGKYIVVGESETDRMMELVGFSGGNNDEK